uniref:VP10 n=1 Tax=Fennes virus TaxID=2707218 RepID=A0A6H0DKD4_9VIRU|nr:MAG: VP10 [Fennes virus]
MSKVSKIQAPSKLSILLFPSVRKSLKYQFRGHRCERIPNDLHRIYATVEQYLESALTRSKQGATLPALKRSLFIKETLKVTVVVSKNDEILRVLTALSSNRATAIYDVGTGGKMAKYGNRRPSVVVLTREELPEMPPEQRGVILQWSGDGARRLAQLLSHRETVRSFIEGDRGVHLPLNSHEIQVIPVWAVTFQGLWGGVTTRATVGLDEDFLRSQFLQIETAVYTSKLELTTSEVVNFRGRYVRDVLLIANQGTRARDHDVRLHRRPHQVIENGVLWDVEVTGTVSESAPNEIHGLFKRVRSFQMVVSYEHSDRHVSGDVLSPDDWYQFGKRNLLASTIETTELLLRSRSWYTDLRVVIRRPKSYMVTVPRDVYTFLDQWLYQKNSEIMYVIGNKGAGKGEMARAFREAGYGFFDSDLYGRIIFQMRMGMPLESALLRYLNASSSERETFPSYFEVQMAAVVSTHKGKVFRDLSSDYSAILSAFQEIYGEVAREIPIEGVFSGVMREVLKGHVIDDGGQPIHNQKVVFFVHASSEADSGMAGICCRLTESPSFLYTLKDRDTRDLLPFEVAYALSVFYSRISSYVCPTFSNSWMYAVIEAYLRH